jgi:hypothetical protein
MPGVCRTYPQFPSDGKPKEVAFPEPNDDVSWELLEQGQGVKYIQLAMLINLKLASALSFEHRYLKKSS